MIRILIGLLVGVILGAGALFYVSRDDVLEGPDPETIASASLQAVQAQNRLTVFAGSFTVAVTSRASRFGFAAEKTMIVPATVRYDIDFSKLSRADIRWDPATSEMQVDLPPIQLSDPEIDLSRMREYEDGKVLMAIGNAEDKLDQANRGKVRAAVLNEAGSKVMVDLAREAGRDAAARAFRLPLEAAGIPAKVTVRYPDESGPGT